MTIRYLAAVLMLTGACVAHADTLPAASTDSSFLSSWTTGNGTDVLSSGVLDNASLIGGVAYGSSSDAAQSLFDKASSSVGTDGSIQLTYAQGIQGTYLLGTSNNILAAMLGDGVSVVGSGTGITVKTLAAQSTAGGVASGGGAQASASAGGTTTASAGGVTASVDTTLTAAGNTGASASAGGTIVSPAAIDPVTGAEVPEPSSIALIAGGLLGFAGLRRRRGK